MDFEGWNEVQPGNLVAAPNAGGCYIITAPGWNQGVPRFLGNDNQGILYIRKSTSSIRGRLREFFRVANRPEGDWRPAQHPGGIRFLALRQRLGEFGIGLENLMIYTLETADPEQMEKAILQCYMKRFGEVPPLNASIGLGNGYVINLTELPCNQW